MNLFKKSVFFCTLTTIPTFIALSQEQPNIVFILADDMGYKDLGCYGNPFNETPVLDGLSKNGMKFSQAYAHPACSPSRAALMTGKHPARLGLTTAAGVNRQKSECGFITPHVPDSLASEEITLAEILKRNGYNTGMVGKWHLGHDKTTMPYAQGFDFDRTISKNGLDYYNYSISSRNKTVFEDTGSVYLTGKLSDYGVEFIQQQNKNQPFFLYLAYSAPHLLIVPKADKVSKYMWKHNKFNGKYNPYYATMVESMDEGIGRVIDELKQKEMLENTLIIFMSDNGGVGMDQIAYRPTTMEPLRKWKGHVYEGGIRVPLIIYWENNIKTGIENNNYMIIDDFLPTFMEILGDNDLPKDLDGKSFLSSLYQPQTVFRRGPVFFHFPHFSGQNGYPAGAVREGDWKLVETFETGQTELFNIAEDISESMDLSEEYPDKSNELYKKLKDWRKKTEAKMPEKK